MPRNPARIALAILLALALVASACSFAAIAQLREVQSVVALKGTGAALTAAQVDAMLDENKRLKEPYALVAWGVKESTSVENADLKRLAPVKVLLAKGELGLIFPGSFLVPERPEDCIIDSETAQKLFGDTAALGAKITYQGKEYTVAGVIENANRLFIIQPSSPDETGFDSLTIKGDGFTTPTSLQEMVSQRFSFPCEILGYDNLYVIAWYLWWIPLALLTILLLRFAWRQFKVEHRKGLYHWFWLAFFVLVCCGFLIPFALTLYVPADALPSKWSNFKLWENSFEARKESLLFLFQAPVRAPELWIYAAFFKATALSISALCLSVGVAWVFGRVVRPAGRPLFSAENARYPAEDTAFSAREAAGAGEVESPDEEDR
jgi:hypothetical protein